MKKEKMLVNIILTVIAALILTAGPAYSIDGPKHGKLLFSYDDDKYDDYGPGSYVYPNGKLFKSNPHMFDIASVKIYEVDEFYRFDVEYKGRIPRSWPGYMGYGNGWILNIAEIYIDRDHKWGSGHTNAALGRNLRFTPESAWDRVVFLSPVASDDMISAIRDKTDDLEFAESLNDFVFPTSINVFDYTLSATVRKSDLGEYSKNWGIQVLSTVLDPSSAYTTFYNQRVYKTATDENFGGGTDLYGAPNVLDMITPKGVSQKDLLSRYRAHPNPGLTEFAKIPCVYGGEENAAAFAGAKPLETNGSTVKKDGLETDLTKKLELKTDENVDLSAIVKERVIETAKAEKPLLTADAGKNKADKRSLKAEPEEDITADLSPEKAPGKTLKNEDQKNIKETEKSAKLKKNKSDNNNIEKDKKNYDEFFKKLDEQKLKVSKNDDENSSFDDIEKFLAAKEKKNGFVKPAKKEKLSGFKDDIYEMARIGDSAGVKGKDAKAKTAAKTTKAIDTAAANGEELKPLIEETLEAAITEPEDRSIVGRLFKKKKKSQKKATDKYAEEKNSDKLLEELKETDSRILPEDTLASIARNELPENSKAKKAKTAAKTETKTQQISIEKDGGAGLKPEDNGCVGNMRTLGDMGSKYIEKHPDARKISMNMLMSGGLLKEPLKCPAGGRYLIEVNGGKAEVTCINVNGTGHGKY